MLAKLLFAAAGIVILTTPAFSDQFYVVHDAATTRCVVAEQTPAEGAGTIVGDGAYADRASAEADMAKIHACISQAAGSDNRR